MTDSLTVLIEMSRWQREGARLAVERSTRMQTAECFDKESHGKAYTATCTAKAEGVEFPGMYG